MASSYPYEEIYYLLEICGLADTPRTSGFSGDIEYVEFASSVLRSAHYRTDGQRFFLWSENQKTYTPFHPHECWDHLIFIVNSFGRQSEVFATDTNIHRLAMSYMLDLCAKRISQFIPGHDIGQPWKELIECMQVIMEMTDDAYHHDGTTIGFVNH